MTIDLDSPVLSIGDVSQPDLRPNRGLPVLYTLWEDVTFILHGQSFTVPSMYELDGMSIPRAVRSISGLEQDGPHRLADLFHDWAYEHQGILTPTLSLSRQKCDDLHRTLCLAAGMEPRICDTIHFFLGLFGGIAWNRHNSAVAFMMAEPQEISVHDLVQFRLNHPSL